MARRRRLHLRWLVWSSLLLLGRHEGYRSLDLRRTLVLVANRLQSRDIFVILIQTQEAP